MKKTLFAFFIIFLTACSATKLITPTQEDADRGSQKFQGYTMSDLEQGKAIYHADVKNRIERALGVKIPRGRGGKRKKKNPAPQF
mgnify:CR=1 FL=1